MKRVLITGAGGYIGTNVRHFLEEYNTSLGRVRYQVDGLSLRDSDWENHDFAGYDTVLHLAGKAHADIAGLSEEEQKEYYKINCDLAVRVAGKAKREGVPQFIYLSSVIVYGDSAPVGKAKHITKELLPAPTNFYGDSKWQAEQKLNALAEEKTNGTSNDADGQRFCVAIVRSPMVYGAGSKGNFPLLIRLAQRTPLFPEISNERSMIYIENLAEFLRLLIESGEGGIYLPQNASYVTTAQMVEKIGGALGKKIFLTKLLNPFVRLAALLPGKVGKMANKAFGSLTIEQGMTGEISGYRIVDLEESIRKSVMKKE